MLYNESAFPAKAAFPRGGAGLSGGFRGKPRHFLHGKAREVGYIGMGHPF
jgi:hypothetical protein